MCTYGRIGPYCRLCPTERHTPLPHSQSVVVEVTKIVDHVKLVVAILPREATPSRSHGSQPIHRLLRPGPGRSLTASASRSLTCCGLTSLIRRDMASRTTALALTFRPRSLESAPCSRRYCCVLASKRIGVGLSSPAGGTGTHSAPAAAAVLPLPRLASSSATGSSFGSGWSALLVMTPSPVLASAAGLGWRGGGGWRRTRWRCCSIWSRPTSAVTERPHRISNRS